MKPSDAAPALGYADPLYAASLAAVGEPRLLNQSGSWILERPIPGGNARDAMGCYPLFAAKDWASLADDLPPLENDLVSLVIVTDPFGAYDEPLLRECFPDRVVPFKRHFVVDLAQPDRHWVSRHHLRNVRKAQSAVRVDVAEPATVLEDWLRLYACLVAQHRIRGIAAFSREAFERQLHVPGIRVLRATEGGSPVGMLLWYLRGDVAYYHLGAYTERGYDLKASFALFDYALEYFPTLGIRWLDLGAEAGAAGSAADGLARFKQGWANTRRTAYLCGRVFQRKRYDELIMATRTESFVTQYFPTYRAGEFA